MECRSVIDSLSDYLDGGLATSQVQFIESHLIQCPPCKAMQADLAQICVAAKELPLRTPSRALWTRIQNEVALDLALPGKAVAPKNSWWKNWSERQFTFSLPQLAGASALAFSLLVFGMYHALHRDPQIAADVSAQAVIPMESEWKSKIQQKTVQINARRVSWSPQISTTYDSNIQRIDTWMSKTRQTLVLSPDSDQQKFLLDLYQQKLQLMEDFEKFEK